MARLDWSRLHAKILRSSLFTNENPMTRLVFLCAVADSEKDGTLFGSPTALARAWNLPEPDVTEALERLQEPDPESTTPDENGRRLVRMGPNEWLVVTKSVHSPSAEPPGASTLRVQRLRARRRETGETNGTGDVTSGTDEPSDETAKQAEQRERLEEKRREEKRTEEKNQEGERARTKFVPPSLDEVRAHVLEKRYSFDPETFHANGVQQGWRLSNGNAMKDWRAACVTWQKREAKPAATRVVIHKNQSDLDRDREGDEIARNRAAADRAREDRLRAGDPFWEPPT